MRYIVLATVVAAGLSLIGAASGLAAPVNGQALSPIASHSSRVIHVRDHCGRGRHRDPHGHCVRD
jgi:hypothetical protein